LESSAGFQPAPTNAGKMPALRSAGPTAKTVNREMRPGAASHFDNCAFRNSTLPRVDASCSIMLSTALQA